MSCPRVMAVTCTYVRTQAGNFGFWKTCRSAARAISGELFASAFSALLAILTPATARAEGMRTLTERDAIEMTVPGDWDYFRPNWSTHSVAKFSPDGSRFVLVLKKGDVASNTTRYSLLLWKAEDIVAGKLSPTVVLEMRSSSNLGGMNHIEWSDDNETVWFTGENPGEKQQVYTVNTRTGTLRRITNHPSSVLAFDHNGAGENVAYIAESPPMELWSEQARRSGLVASQYPYLSLPELMLGLNNSGALFDRAEMAGAQIYLSNSGRVAPVVVRRAVAPALFSALGGTPFSIAPDGTKVVIATDVPLREIPKEWSGYADPFLQDALAGRVALTRTGFGREDLSGIQAYELYTASSGISRILLPSPLRPPLFGPPEKPVWSPDSQSIVVSEVFLPLSGKNIDRQKAAGRPVTVEVDTGSGAINQIERCLRAIRWDRSTGELVCVERSGSVQDRRASAASFPSDVLSARDRPAHLVGFRKVGQEWKEVPDATLRQTDLDVFVKEDMNTPPKIYARLGRTRNAVLLSDLNPQLSHVQLGRVEDLSWEWSKGRHIRAGLYYPPHYEPARRYPLVIQGHGWDRTRFQIDGPDSTGYAAQALAARDIVVLQLDDLVAVYDPKAPREERNDVVRVYRSGIALLQEKGMIDPRKVGVLGFSQTCDYVSWALTHAPSLFAAASMAEGPESYLFFMSYPGRSDSSATLLYGGPPVGSSLAGWVRDEPSFNLGKVRAPVRLNVLAASLWMLSYWEWFEGLTLLHKPVDMVMLESAEHVLIKPAERMVVSGGNVDWFDFWLNGQEDPDPVKSEQYRRWEKLCDQQRANNPGRLAFCVPSNKVVEH